MSVWRRIRSALSTGLTWAVVCGVVGVIASPWLAARAHAVVNEYALNAAIIGIVNGWYGFLAGTIFAGVVAVAARHRSLRELTLLKAGLWGTMASLVFTVPPTIFMLAQRRDGWRSDDMVYLSGSLVLCTGCAIGTLLLARRGSRLDAAVDQSALAAEHDPLVVREFKAVERASTAT